MLNRRGKIKISADFIKEENLSLLQNVLSRMIVIEAYNSFVSNRIEYVGISEEFDEVGNGEEIPEYYAVIHTTRENTWDEPVSTFVGFKRYD